MSAEKILGVLAGNDTPIATVQAWAEGADWVIAADGAANALLGAGIALDAIVGDMDSIDPVLERSDVDYIEDPDQETTDCEKLLLHVKNCYPAANLALAGVEGDRFDHVLSSIFSVARILPGTLLVLRDGFARCVVPGQAAEFRTKTGDLVSMIPILPCDGAKMEGVKWTPAQDMAPLGSTSTSNEAVADRVRASIEAGAALLIHQTKSAEPAWI